MTFDPKNHDQLVIFTSPSFELWRFRREDGSGPFFKRLPISYRQEASRVAQFDREHRYVEALDPPHFPKFVKSTLDDQETAYQFASDNFVPLSRLLRTGNFYNKPVPLSVGIHLLEQILETILFVERRRELNPEDTGFLELNPYTIFVDYQGLVHFSHLHINAPPTLSSSIVRSRNYDYVTYSAPEQFIRGRSPGVRTTAYSLGMICFELLSGKPLFSSIQADTIDLITHRKARNLHPFVSDVRGDLRSVDAIVSAMLNPLPESRLCDYDEVGSAIQSLSTLDSFDCSDSFQSYMNLLDQLEAERADQIVSNGIESTLAQVTDITELNAS